MVVTMSTDRVIKHFDVIEHITPRLLAVIIVNHAAQEEVAGKRRLRLNGTGSIPCQERRNPE